MPGIQVSTINQEKLLSHSLAQNAQSTCSSQHRSKHEEIELVTEEEFYQEAPPEISRPHITKNDPHQLTLARLDWELEQRKR